ncbi:MAG: hypothetical protein U0559_01200 [Anaerolineae bacterium]
MVAADPINPPSETAVVADAATKVSPTSAASTTLTQPRKWRVSPVIVIANALLLVGIVVAIYRFAFGIGAIKRKHDSYPWGFWIRLRRSMAWPWKRPGAFTMAAAVYIFKLEALAAAYSILTGFWAISWSSSRCWTVSVIGAHRP